MKFRNNRSRTYPLFLKNSAYDGSPIYAMVKVTEYEEGGWNLKVYDAKDAFSCDESTLIYEKSGRKGDSTDAEKAYDAFAKKMQS